MATFQGEGVIGPRVGAFLLVLQGSHTDFQGSGIARLIRSLKNILLVTQRSQSPILKLTAVNAQESQR